MGKNRANIYIKKEKGQLVNVSKSILAKLMNDNWDKVLQAKQNNSLPLVFNMYPGEMEFINDHFKLGANLNDLNIYMDTYHPNKPLVTLRASIKNLTK